MEMEKVERDKKAPTVKLLRGLRMTNKCSIDDVGVSTVEILTSFTTNRTNEEHPLLNPMLVSIIIDLVNPDFKSFQQLRLVCKTWHDATFHQWRKKAVLRIVPDATPFDDRKRYNGISFMECIRELEDPQSPFQILQKPFRKYRLIGFDINVIVCDDPSSAANHFWTVYGPLMNYIHLDTCTIRNTYHRALVQLLVRHIPNATQLVLSSVTLVDAMTGNMIAYNVDGTKLSKRRPFNEIHPKLTSLTVYGNLRMSLFGLLKMAPQLQTIRGYDLVNSRMEYFSLAYAIQTAKELNKNSPLFSQFKHFDMLHSSALMKCRFGDFVELGRDPSLQLETLAVQLSPSPFYNAVGHEVRLVGNINPFLASVSGTLKKLTVFRAPIGPPFPMFLCVKEMRALTELCLLGTVAQDFQFLEFTPNLKKLRIDLGCFEQRDAVKELVGRGEGDPRILYRKNRRDMTRPVYWLETPDFWVMQLESFEIDHLFRNSKSWKILGEVMPNLKTLKTVVNARIVPVICEQWKGLTELVCLHGSSLNNSDFFTEEHRCSTRKAVKNISDLKDLEKFQLDAICGGSKLTDGSVFKGLLKMPSLRRVQICVNHRMTIKAEKALKNGIEFCRVIRNYAEPGGDHADYDCCARLAFDTEARLGLQPRTDIGEIIENNKSEELDMD